MNPRTRILMLEPNRYRALLLHRALVIRIPEAIVVRFDAAEPALAELCQGTYRGAIINLDSVTAAQSGRLKDHLQGHRSTSAVLLVSPETSRRSLAASIDIVDSVLMSISADPDDTANQLALRLLASQSEASERPIQSPLHLLPSTPNGE